MNQNNRRRSGSDYSMADRREEELQVVTRQLLESLTRLLDYYEANPLSRNPRPLTQGQQQSAFGSMVHEGPLSLVHVGTNHRLKRYNILIYGGVDGYSRKIMYLNTATNHRASTAYGFFREATKRHGVPSRVKGNQGFENVRIALFMFSVRGTDRGSYITGNSVSNRRIGRLWRDVRVMVTNRYYEILHSLETDGLLDISSTKDVFCVHHTILPRLQSDLERFARVWNHHSLRTERSWSPEQLWVIGMMTTDVVQPDLPEEPDIDWEVVADYDGENEDFPEFECPLNPEDLSEMQSVLEQTDPKTPVREFYLLCREYVAAKCSS